MILDSKAETKISKLLSYILRHKPEEIGVSLDSNGWVELDVLISQLNIHGHDISFDQIKYVVDNSPKKRFTFNDKFTKIRANQGHSLNINLDLKPVEPPQFLYHGTAAANKDSIHKNGIKKMNRQFVHLSDNIDTAINVGQRHGKPIVLKIKAREMFINGSIFYLSDNGVWLTDAIHKTFIICG